MTHSLIHPSTQKKFLVKLLLWYKKHGRHDMPWRKTKDPYRIFVSEFMLQQTTVATVRPYYDRFLKKFPTLRSLARGNINDVLALWSGLGYYARARNLWQAMRQVQEKHRGKIPADLALLEELPGVGPYTAGAIASFAYNKPAPVLDGNIIRVLMRILGIEDDPKMKPVQAVLRKVAFDLSNQATSRDVNLALMDLGATLCAPQDPECEACPVSSFCQAKAAGRQNAIPLRGEKGERPTLRRLQAAIRHNDKWLMGQRPKTGLFGGLWEFVGMEASSGVDTVNYLEEKVKELYGLDVRVERALPMIQHQLSHRVLMVRTFLTSLTNPQYASVLPESTRDYERIKWIYSSQIGHLGISSVTKRVWQSLNKV